MSCATLEGISRHSSPLLMGTVYDTCNRKISYSPVKSAVWPLCTHSQPCNEYFQTVEHIMSTHSCTNDTTCSICECSHTFPQYLWLQNWVPNCNKNQRHIQNKFQHSYYTETKKSQENMSFVYDKPLHFPPFTWFMVLTYFFIVLWEDNKFTIFSGP